MDDRDSVARPTPPPPALLSPERIAIVQAKIRCMEPETVQEIAAQFVPLDSSGILSRWIDIAHAQAQARVRAQTFNFGKHARQADYVLNKKYERISGSNQYGAAGDAQEAVEAMLDDIVARTREDSVYPTKKSAVETMRSIFESVLDSVGVIGKEVRDDCDDWDAKFLKIMGTFTEYELERLATEDDGAWVEKFRALVAKANGCCILEKLQESLDDLDSYQAGEEGEENKEENYQEGEEGEENEEEDYREGEEGEDEV